jgi:hypothetical protein
VLGIVSVPVAYRATAGGKQETAHCFAASAGGMTIVNAERPEELNEISLKRPQPLCDVETAHSSTSRDRWIDLIDRLEKARG